MFKNDTQWVKLLSFDRHLREATLAEHSCTIYFILDLKEYYEIVGESRPLSVFFLTHADFFTEMHFYS